MHASNGILFNHESPVRGETFVTRKITRALCRITVNLQEKLYIGNLNAKRDWGHARDYVEAMWLVLQQDEPDDYVIATGEQHSVREFIEAAAGELGMHVEWRGNGVDEVGIDRDSGRELVRIDPRYFRPTEVESLLGDPTKAKKQLGWVATTSFSELVSEMLAASLEEAKRDAMVKDAGYQTFDYHE